MAEGLFETGGGREVLALSSVSWTANFFDVQIGPKSQEGLHAGIRWDLLAEAAL